MRLPKGYKSTIKEGGFLPSRRSWKMITNTLQLYRTTEEKDTKRKAAIIKIIKKKMMTDKSQKARKKKKRNKRMVKKIDNRVKVIHKLKNPVRFLTRPGKIQKNPKESKHISQEVIHSHGRYSKPFIS